MLARAHTRINVETASHKMAYDHWVKDLKAKNPWQLGPTEGESFADDSFSLTKLNDTNFTYLGHANPISCPSYTKPSSVDHCIPHSFSIVSHPIVGLQEASLYLHVSSHNTGKPQNFSSSSFDPPTNIDLEFMLPPTQKAPRYISGEFQISNAKYQTSNIKLTSNFCNLPFNNSATPDWFIPTIQRIISSPITTLALPNLKFELTCKAIICSNYNSMEIALTPLYKMPKIPL
jgi:hypothetical protein